MKSPLKPLEHIATTCTVSTLLVSLINGAFAQDCYYPNGDLARGMAACTSNGGMCCPYQWECLSNGLCYLGNAQYFGRYTCTDQTWQSSSCPQMCTEGNTASGNEALLQCSDGSWCCDGNRSFNCCTTPDETFFSLAQGSSIAYISSVPSPTGASTPASSNPPTSTTVGTPAAQSDPASSPSRLSAPSSSAAAPSSPSSQETSAAGPASSDPASSSDSPSESRSSPSASTITSSASTTGTNGAVSTVTLVSTATSAQIAASSTSPNPSPVPGLGLVIGLAVGIPVALLACAILACQLRRRRRARRRANVPPSTTTDTANMTDMYARYQPPEGRAPEIDSYPVAPGRTKSGRKSELEGSLPSPAMSTATTTTTTTTTNNGGAPPQYSPISPNLHSVQEEPQELWGGYVPYRPPRAEPATDLPATHEARDD